MFECHIYELVLLVSCKALASVFQYIFADVQHKVIFTTTNMGQTFYKATVSFVPKQISFHPTERNHLLAHDENDPEKRVRLILTLKTKWLIFQVFCSYEGKLYLPC